MASGADGGVRRWVAEVFHQAVVEAVGRVLTGLAIAGAAGIVYLFSEGGTVPAWLLAVVVFVFAALGVWATHIIVRRLGASQDSELESELERHVAYSQHIGNALDSLESVISGDVDTDLPFYLDQAVLAPAQRLLTERPAEAVRLSVLIPSPEDPERWSMAWAAGHSMQGRLKFDEKIDETLSRHAYRTGKPQYWRDAAEQTEFVQNPLASANTRSLMSIPLSYEGAVQGVFNAVAAEPDAFDEAERTFLASLGAIIGLAVSYWAARATPVQSASSQAARADRDGS